MERRNTRQRQLILDAVQSRCDHPNAEQIYRQVRERDPKISLGTVYRNLAILAEEGKILDLRLSEADRFDRTTAPHDHFFCECCGKLFDVNTAGSKEQLAANTASSEEPRQPFAEDGFFVRSCQTLFSGLCPQCREPGTEEEGFC